MKKSGEKNIRRVTSGWQVVINRNGEQYTKCFSTKKYGGVRKALAAAIECRDVIVRDAPTPSKGAAQVRMGRNDGIYETTEVKAGKEYSMWVASWTDKEGRRKKRSFSINKYGALRAQQRAREARQRGVARMDQV